MTRLKAFLPLLALSACMTGSPKASPDFLETEWRHEDGQDAQYLLAPGDTIEVIVHSAPELSRMLTVAPDGRVRMPYTDPVMASARTIEEVDAALTDSLATQLRYPDLDVIATEFASQQIFVGGEVGNPGIFELPGQIDPLQAVVMAGGFTETSRPSEVILMRRLPGGDIRTAVFDVQDGIFNPQLAAWTPLRRFDVVYVPRSRIADQNRIIQQWVRSALPISFSFFYDIAGNN